MTLKIKTSAIHSETTVIIAVRCGNSLRKGTLNLHLQEHPKMKTQKIKYYFYLVTEPSDYLKFPNDLIRQHKIIMKWSH